MAWGEDERAFMLPRGTLQHPALEFSREAARLSSSAGWEGKNRTGLSLHRCGTEMGEGIFFLPTDTDDKRQPTAERAEAVCPPTLSWHPQ